MIPPPNYSKLPLRLDVQGLRAIAVIAVVAYHSGLPVSGGFLGVDVFFVISGFVITGSISKTNVIHFGRALRDFYLRRYRRLIPALSLMVLFTLVVGLLLLSPFGPMQNTAKTGIGAMLLSANLVIERTTGGYFDVAAESNPLLHTWSLSVEEQFYLVFPVVVFTALILTKALNKIRKITILIIVSAITFSSMYFAITGEGQNFGFYNPFARAWEFGFGALIFLLPISKLLNRSLCQFISIVGLCLVFASFFLISESDKTPGLSTLVPTFGAALFILAGKNSYTPFPNAALSKSLPVWIGNLSYSWYLWHWPFIVFSVLIFQNNHFLGIIAGISSLVPAYFSKKYVEDKFTPRWTLPQLHKIKYFVLFTLLPITIAASVLLFINSGFGTNKLNSLVSQQQQMHTSVTNGCLDLLEVVIPIESQCSWNIEDNNKPVYLVGDSHADMFSEGILEAASSLSLPISIRTNSGCPFLDTFVLLVGQTPDDANKCRQRYLSTMEWLLKSPPGTVIVSNSADYFMENDISVGPSIDDISMPTTNKDQKTKQEIYVGSLTASLKLLEERGFNVIVIAPTPHLSLRSGWPTNCTTIELLANGCLQEVNLSLASEPIREIIEKTSQVTKSVGGESINLIKSICLNSKCSSVVGDVLIFRDGDHISVEMSRYLSAKWVEILQNIR